MITEEWHISGKITMHCWLQLWTAEKFCEFMVMLLGFR